MVLAKEGLATAAEQGVWKAQCVAWSSGIPQEVGTWSFPHLREHVEQFLEHIPLPVKGASAGLGIRGPFPQRPRRQSKWLREGSIMM